VTTPLEQFFESLATEAELRALTEAPGREEDLHLEFKQKADRSNGGLADGDRRAFSEALSAFANADGGVLVFGIETAKDQAGTDRATDLRPIADYQPFCRRLGDLVLNTTQPVVEGVRVEPLPSEAERGSGYVKCLIPQSYRPPHRAMHAGQQYWIRSSTGTRRMDHFELEDVFGRRLRPDLLIGIEAEPRSDDPQTVQLSFRLLNEGRGIAKHAGFLCSLSGASVQQTFRGLANATTLNRGAPTLSYNAQGVIHANGIWSVAGGASVRRDSLQTPLVVDVKVYAENMATKTQTNELLPAQESSD